MVNGSFVFGLDDDGPDVFDRTVAWAMEQGVETATFDILTPYPGTALYDRMEAEGRMLHRDRYDTRQVVYRPSRLTASQLTDGHHRGRTGTSTAGRRSGAGRPARTACGGGFGERPATNRRAAHARADRPGGAPGLGSPKLTGLP
jgi:hypothetical protein